MYITNFTYNKDTAKTFKIHENPTKCYLTINTGKKNRCNSNIEKGYRIDCSISDVNLLLACWRLR